MEEEPYIEFKNGKGPYISDTQLNQLQKLIKIDIKNQVLESLNLMEELKEKTQKNIMTRKFSRQNVTVNQSWGTTKIPFSSATSQGNKLITDTNGIRIGSGVSKVLVSAQCSGIGTNVVSGDKQFLIIKGTEKVGKSYLGGGININFMNLCISPILLDVEENDVISLEVGSGTAGNFEILDGQLTVEVIEESEVQE